MGWLFYHKDGNEKPIDNLRRELFDPKWMERVGGKIVAEATSKGVCYFALNRRADGETKYEIGPDGTYTVAIVVLHQSARDHHNFGYKDMDECMGPCEAEAPASFLAKLSPTTHEHALDWRASCTANAAKKKNALKLTHGLKVKLPYKLPFKAGEVDTFEVVVWKGKRDRTYFRAPFGLVRLRPEEKRDLVAA